MTDQTDNEGQGGGRRRRASGGAEARRAARRAGSNVQLPAIIRKIPEYEVLDEEGLSLIEHNADLVLEQYGIDIRDDDETVSCGGRPAPPSRPGPTRRASRCRA